MKVTEFARRIGFPASRIRYYDRMGIIRGDRRDNNYRDFTPEDVFSLYNAWMLRSYGIGLEECAEVQHGDIQDMASVLEKNIERIIEEMERQEKLLLRLRTMHSFCMLFADPKKRIHSRYLSNCYEIFTFGKNVKMDRQNELDVRTLVDHMPYSYMTIQITKESILSNQENPDVRIGVGILEENLQQLGVSIPSANRKQETEILEFLMEKENPLAITRTEIQPFLDEIARRGIELSDLTGRIYCSYGKNGKSVYGFGLAVPVTKTM
ncbi:MAG: MerR family transcriptional regulator [Bulleidia sp.]